MRCYSEAALTWRGSPILRGILDMSADFRPVREIWGEPSGQLLDLDEFTSFLEVISDRVESLHRQDDYNDKTLFWIQNGAAFLNYIEKNPEFTAVSMKDALEESNWELKLEEVAPQVRNFKASANDWRKNLAKDGSLRFYID
jgi:hypothetical protein